MGRVKKENMKITYEYGSHKDNHETFIDILPCLSVGKLDFKGYFINFEWLLWYIVLYINKED